MTRLSQMQRGFGLTELMVGALISIIASMVIFQVFSTAERQKRTTTGAADAQSNGAIATYMIERDVKMAGWGMNYSVFSGCTNVFSYYNNGTTTSTLSDLFASAKITDGGSNPDSITIQYYDNPSADQNFKFAMTTLRSSMPQSSSELNVNSVYGCAENALAIVKQGANCTLMQITQVQKAALKLQHNPGGTPTYNPSAAYQNANGWPAYSTGAQMQCFPATQIYTRTYAIGTNHLTLQETGIAGTMQVAPEIVDLQAEYGVAPAGSQTVNQWVAATGSWVSPLSTANASRVKALRIAVVARSAQAEKPDASGTCSTTTSTSGWSTWASFPAIAQLADWQCYRYKVFETIVPLRNVIWANI